MQINFVGKHVLVVGGSSSIGLAIAQGFRSAGASVTITGTRTSADYDSDFSGLDYRQFDASMPGAVDAFAETFVELDVLVWSVATVAYKRREFEPQTFRRVLEVNLSAAMDIATLLHPKLARSRGSLIFISSIVAAFATRGTPAYGASKAAMGQLSRSLAAAWAKQGVRVNAIAPGFVETKMTRVSQDNAGISEAIVARTPMARWGQASDMVGPALFLASDLAGFVTGQTLVVDGGYSITV